MKSFWKIDHQLRAIIFMIGALIFYLLWLWFVPFLGIHLDKARPYVTAAVFLAPLVPVAVIDLYVRLRWKQEMPTLAPPPPKAWEKLLRREYGLYWFPGLICVPLWIWVVGLLGWLLVYAIRSSD
jgi:hypothetical protein